MASGRKLDHSRLRVLVVEDTLLAAEALCELLELNGCTSVGPAPRCSKALSLLQREEPDAALLDINLAGEYSFPVAEALQERGIPFAFLTGYTDDAVVPLRYRAVPKLGKPLDVRELQHVLVEHFESATTDEDAVGK
jgi:DNA-binding response OmpR family regulator